MPFSKEEQAAIWHAINRASDDLANWRPDGPEEEEAHENGMEQVDLAFRAMAREYPR
jgi:hypothetical protein